ncbi:hypothetical protein NGM10_12200 [Halorussus salilacus]|uniref:sialidase family protein n=1 Tax=Halorussus salilacus TaxID=2953750 RepID=UPI00209E95E8|nr:hypothetical protein [Halorussus salilacus]USZ67486.1 hypothetical protein NGM10_12200 [Halorussus salilacus]
MARGVRSAGFVAYYRRYTKTWVHALATAMLTIFGILTFVHPGFAAVAVASYVLPPVLLYAAGRDPTPAGVGSRGTATDEPGIGDSDPDPGATTDPEPGRDGEGDSADRGDRPARWTAVETPTDADLFDAVLADDRAFAVGDDGVVLTASGEGWRVVLEDGPGANEEALWGADATDDGRAVWAAGDGGALARLDAETGRHVDHSAPRGITDNWTDVAVGGEGGDEAVLLANGSGEVLRGRYREGEVAWDAPTKPGSGSSIAAVALEGGAGFVCDTNDDVFETTDGGESFRRIGIDDVDGTLTDLAVTDSGDPAASGDDGVVYRSDAGNWTPVRVDDDAILALAFRDGRGVACGDEGVVYESAGGATDWERIATPATGTLRGIAIGAQRAVAVGDDGLAVERG